MPGTAVASIEVDTLAREVYPHVDTRKRRNGNLDALRGIAILLVFGRHFGGNALWNQIGWAGVDLFFVLSGFLISGLLFHDWQEYGSLRIGRFYWRRALKIYPSFYFLMGITVLVEGLRPGGLNLVWPMTPAHLAAELFFLQNYAVGMWGHTWSLAVEEHFYVCLPLLLLFIRRNGRDPFGRLPTVFSVVATLCLLLRLTTGEAGHYGTRIAPTHLRADSLLFGVLLSYYRMFQPEMFARLSRSRMAAAVTLFAVGLLIWIPVENPLMYTFGFTILYLGFGFLLARVVEMKPLPLGPVAWLGGYSYSIYLWHLPIARLLPHGTPFACFVILSVVAGFLCSHLVERPVLSLRDRLFPSRLLADESVTAGATAAGAACA